MKNAGIVPTEKVGFQKFWADVKKALPDEKKSGESIVSFNLCGKCIERCHDTMENFINTMLRGNNHEHEEV